MDVPLDFIAALDCNLKAKVFYETLNKSSRYTIAYGLLSAKKPETRLRRFTKFMEMLVNKQKPLTNGIRYNELLVLAQISLTEFRSAYVSLVK